MTGIERRMDDIEFSNDNLKCKDCKNRLPDVKLSSGRLFSCANKTTCLVFEDKPVNYMWGDCPEYVKE